MGNAKIFLFDNDETLDSYRAGGVKKSHHHAAAMLRFFISSTVYILNREILAILFSFGSFTFLPAGLGGKSIQAGHAFCFHGRGAAEAGGVTSASL